MNSIERVNDQYVKELKITNSLEQCSKDIKKAMSLDAMFTGPTAGVIAESVDALSRVQKSGECKAKELLADTVSVGKSYIECDKAINDYKNAMLKSRNGGMGAVREQISRLEWSQKHFSNEKERYRQKYGMQMDSVDTLYKTCERSIFTAISEEGKEVERLKKEAKEIAGQGYSVELHRDDPIDTAKELPESLLTAKYATRTTLPVLNAVGIYNTYNYINIDLREQGNIIIDTTFEQMNDQKIDQFVLSYIFKYIETFPLGTVNVHIYGQNLMYLYPKLYNSFHVKDSGERLKAMIRMHDTLDFLQKLRDVTVKEIFAKTTVTKHPDLYSLYDVDAAYPFNLIVLRGSFLGGDGYAQADQLNVLEYLTNTAQPAHKSGLRFLIVNDSPSFIKQLKDTSRHWIEAIHNNCELRMDYNNGEFTAANNKLEVLRVQGNLDMYVEERAAALGQIINQKVKDIVSIDDIYERDTDKKAGYVISIPVGKSAGKIVEVPLSCKDVDGTLAGQCVGYMVLGLTGTGKSSFFHSMVLSGCKKYSPKDLQFWLLDFKNGGASSKYTNSGIPHIKIIAENNKIDDALCLFQMVLEEMERRSKAFNRCFTDNIVDYNKKALAEGLEYFPRIIIAIDEVQEIFRDDNASETAKLISAISTRMRSAGMHFVMVAQNLSDGKAYMLKDCFLPSATGRLCFRVARPEIVRDSGFGEEFISRTDEIMNLERGEAYLSYGKGTTGKIKLAFADLNNEGKRYFNDICKYYPEFADMRPLVIGSKKRLAITDAIQGSHTLYRDVVKRVEITNGMFNAVIGEDVYRMTPVSIQFSQVENSSVLFLGSDKKMASSLCASIAVSLIRQNAKVHLFNGNRVKIRIDSETIQHPFMYVCQNIKTYGENAENHRLNQLPDVLKELYTEYLNRQKQVQQAEDEAPIFTPIFMLVNDLFAIESFTSNDIVENKQSLSTEESDISEGFNFNYGLFQQPDTKSKKTGEFRENVQNIMSTLLKNGYRYNMHLILAIDGDPSVWRGTRVAADVNNLFLFNKTDYADQLENSYYLKTMLRNIANENNEDETLAVWSSKKSYSKIRPIIYDMSVSAEKTAIADLME